jgi:hypothetical protein
MASYPNSPSNPAPDERGLARSLQTANPLSISRISYHFTLLTFFYIGRGLIWPHAQIPQLTLPLMRGD